jgi:hypothetical protein
MRAPIAAATRLRVDFDVIPPSSVWTDGCRHRDRNPSTCIARIDILKAKDESDPLDTDVNMAAITSSLKPRPARKPRPMRPRREIQRSRNLVLANLATASFEPDICDVRPTDMGSFMLAHIHA